MKRVAVFIDYQNCYGLCRRAFFTPQDGHWHGQIQPLLLAQELIRHDPDRILAGIHVFRGMPDSRKQPKANSACSRQINAWAKSGVHTVWRPLRYPSDWPTSPAEEKGVDVQLAIDYVMNAHDGAYDVGIMFCGDTDQKPSLLAVEQILGPDAVEVAAWSPPNRFATRISLRNKGGGQRWPYCHLLDRAVYERVKDDVDYNVRI